MNTFTLNNKIRLCCVRALSFPDGVMDAFKRLHKAAPPKPNRLYMSVSWLGEKQQIEYLAGATELVEGEMSGSEFEFFEVVNGEYIYIDIHNFMNNISAIGQAFSTLLALPDTADDTVCVEWYMNDTLCRCMVRKR
jgi:hypothetical protein